VAPQGLYRGHLRYAPVSAGDVAQNGGSDSGAPAARVIGDVHDGLTAEVRLSRTGSQDPRPWLGRLRSGRRGRFKGGPRTFGPLLTRSFVARNARSYAHPHWRLKRKLLKRTPELRFRVTSRAPWTARHLLVPSVAQQITGPSMSGRVPNEHTPFLDAVAEMLAAAALKHPRLRSW
jgi:hypothetical protein